MSYKTLISFSLVCTALVFAGCKGQNRYLGQGGSSTNGSSSTGTTGTNTSTSNFATTAQAMNASTTAKTLTWDLVSQLKGTSPLSGGPNPKFSISVQIVPTGTGGNAYQFANPTVTGGGSAVEVQNIGIMINGVAVSTATTYSTLDRFIPASPSSRVLSPTNMVVEPGSMAASDTLQITFGGLQNTTFNPPTFTQLISSSGIFGSKCVSCHNANNKGGNLDLTNYAYISSHSEAVPFDVTDSIIYQQTSSGTMPQGGTPLSAAEEQQIKDWINDGAQNN